MRPPWLGHSRDEAELEALQTDIMRFMAILGLCLAAIFSLVQGAAQEQAAAEQSAGAHTIVRPAAVEQVVLEQASREQTTVPNVTVEETTIEQAIDPAPAAQEPAPPIVKSPPVVGFTLEFASVQALEMLLQAGRVQLFARHRDQFWSVDRDGVAVPAHTPSSYYQMHTETVPQRLRSSVPDNGIGTAVTWGVTLPTEAIGQIQGLTAGRKGGNLLIGNDGEVALESASANISTQNSDRHSLLQFNAEVDQREY